MKGQKGEKRDPGKLLREEKMRKRIAKELPKVEEDLRNTLENWEDEYGRPFCVHGQRYLDELDAAQAKPQPPRAKTPNALSRPATEAPKSGGRSQAASRAGTLRGPPPPRSKTPTGPPKMSGRPPLSASAFTSSVMSSSVMSSSVSTHSNGRLSPSKIPGAGGSRLPMSTLRDGNNSPERSLRAARSQIGLGHKASQSEDLNSTIRGRMGPPARAPPPKMKDLFVPPTPTPSGHDENVERSASVVRHVEPEDPYYTSTHDFKQSVMGPPPPRTARPDYYRSTPSQESYASSHAYAHSTASSVGRPTPHADYPNAPPTRQTSNTSSVMSNSQNGSQVSGSENWETYTDASDTEEQDATDAYYAKVQASQQKMKQQYAPIKRPGTAAGHVGANKRYQQTIVEERENGTVEGSDAGWIDDGDVGDTY